MSNYAKSQLTKGLILLCGLILLNACADKKPPFSIIEEPPERNSLSKVEALIPEPLAEEPIVYQAGSPQTYIVQKGDTLWDISSVFLRDPWFWPEIWFKNPQVENPHLIFPGDILSIVYIGGQKRIQISQRGADGLALASGLKTVKLSPRVRTKSIDASIPSIPIESIRHLLSRPLIIDKDQLDRSAYIISSVDAHLVNSINDKLYVRKLDTTSGNGRYQIFRPNKPMIDPITGELLGYEALYVGETKLLKGGDPATVRVTNSVREILRNDRIMPLDNTNFDRDFFPRPPANEIRGEIVSLLDAIAQLGQYQTVAINLGQRDGIETGNLLRIKRIGDVIRDLEEKDPNFRVKLPDENIGMVMVVRSFEKMSYALVMEADRPVGLSDYVETP